MAPNQEALDQERERIRRALLDMVGEFTGEFTGTHDHDGSSFSVIVFYEDDFRGVLNRALYPIYVGVPLPAPGMTDLMVSPESITTEPEMLEYAPPIQTADAGEAFQGQAPDPYFNEAEIDFIMNSELGEEGATIIDEDEFRRRRDQSAERYTREDGSPK